MKKEGFKPMINDKTEIIVLGTMPGDVSIQTGEYYANPKNKFWKIIFKIFNDEYTEFSYQKKTELLLINKVGLWDVLTKGERIGSSDTNIQEEEFNDFIKLFEDFPKINTVVFNGKKALKYFKGLKSIPHDKDYYLLPSTSSANTSKTFEQKHNEWSKVLKTTKSN